MATEPRAEIREEGLVYDVWHLDSAGQAMGYAGSVSTLPDALRTADATPQDAESKAASVWVEDPTTRRHFFVDPDGLVLLLVEARSAGQPFQDRLYAARGDRASPSGLTPSEVPNARAPRPSEEAISAARAAPKIEPQRARTPEEAKRFEEDRKRQEDERKRREADAKREAEGLAGKR